MIDRFFGTFDGDKKKTKRDYFIHNIYNHMMLLLNTGSIYQDTTNSVSEVDRAQPQPRETDDWKGKGSRGKQKRN